MDAMNKWGKYFILFFLIVTLSACGKEEPETVPEYVLTYAENHEMGYPTTEGAVKFKELVEERTEGKVVIQIKAGGEFGNQKQIIEQLQFGGIDFARISISSICDSLPKLNVLQLPFLYRDSEHMWSVLDGEIGDEFLEEFEKMGLLAMSWYDGGARSFYSRRKPIQQLSDIEDMVIRVQDSSMMTDMITLLGGTPVVTAYSDVYSGLETGEFDAAENSWSSYELSNHSKVAKFYTLDEHTRVPEVQLVSHRTWYQLPDAYRKIILECAIESSDYQKELWKTSEEEAKKEATKKGTVTIVLKEEEHEKFQNRMTPLYEKYCSEYMELIDQIMNHSS